MYRVMLVSNSQECLKELQALDAFQNNTEFVIDAVMCDSFTAYEQLRTKQFDLVITEVSLPEMDGLELLRKIKEDDLCSYVALFGEEENFSYARQGMIYGACDYFVKPFSSDMLANLFFRIQQKEQQRNGVSEAFMKNCVSYIYNHDSKYRSYVDSFLEECFHRKRDLVQVEHQIVSVFEKVAGQVFRENPWMELYVSMVSFYPTTSSMDSEFIKHRYRIAFYRLFDEYTELMPPHKENTEEVILYILSNPNKDLRQKTIAKKLNFNVSFLSTIFSAQTGILFVDYVTKIKMKRAGLLLQNTNLTITYIGIELGYHDLGYFSKLFKKEYDLTPSEYRMGSWDYQI